MVGNKSDLENSVSGSQRVISHEQGLAAAKKYGIEFIETSAKTNKNVDKAFMLLLRKIVDSGMIDSQQSGMQGQALRELVKMDKESPVNRVASRISIGKRCLY